MGKLWGAQCNYMYVELSPYGKVTTPYYIVKEFLALCKGNPPATGGFPSQKANILESGSVPWRRYMFAGI